MNYTLAVIKPNVIENRQIGEVLRLMNFWGFEIVDMKYIASADIEFVKKFYGVHRNKEFYDSLVNGMTNRPWLAIKLSHKISGDVVSCWRTWLQKIRLEYSGEEPHDNAVHGSDSIEAAQQEIDLIFGSQRYVEFKDDNSKYKIKLEDISSVKISGVKSTVLLNCGLKRTVSADIGRRISKLLK